MAQVYSDAARLKDAPPRAVSGAIVSPPIGRFVPGLWQSVRSDP